MSDSADILAYHRFLLYETGGRLDAYRRALEAVVRPDSVVLDLGAGTGVLSIIAARAGARRVFAVERDDAASYAEEVITANGLAHVITVIHGDARSAILPEPPDVMVMDIFGSFGLRAGGLAALVDARDRLLRPGARLIPETIELFIAPAEADDSWRECVGVWGADVAGVRMDVLRQRAVNARYPVRLEKSHLLGRAVRIGELSLGEIRNSTLRHETVVPVGRPGILRGFCGWYAASLSDGVRITNEPGANGLNYAQCFLPLAQPTPVEAGDSVSLNLDNRDNELLRWRGTIRREDSGDSDVTFDHCTFLGSPLSSAMISAASAD
jgi:protein arginine N-methyltransferase 1